MPDKGKPLVGKPKKPSLFWSYPLLVQSTPAGGPTQDRDIPEELEKDFANSQGEGKEKVAREILKEYGERGIQFLSKQAIRSPIIGGDVEKQKQIIIEAVRIVIKALGEIKKAELVPPVLDSLEQIEREGLLKYETELGIDRESLREIYGEIQISRLVLQTTSPSLFYEYVRGYYPNWGDAAQGLKTAIALRKAGFKEYAKLVELYLTHRRVAEARQMLERLRSSAIAEKYPVETDYLEARVFIEEGNLEEAKALLKEHMDQANKYPIIYAALGELLRKMGKPDEARFMFVLAYKNLPSFYEMLLKIGHTYYDKHDWRRALNIYQNLINIIERRRMDPTEVEQNILTKAYDRLGAIYLIKELFDDAKQALKNSLFYDPTFPSAIYDMATVEFRIGVQKKDVARLNQALALYDKVIEAKELVSEALFGKARCLEEIGRFTKDRQKQILAREIYEGLASGTNPFPNALVKLTELVYYENNFPKMLELAEKSVKLLPNDALAALDRGEAYRWNGRYEEAAQEYLRAKELAKEEGNFDKYEIQIQFGIADCLDSFPPTALPFPNGDIWLPVF